MQYAPGDTFDVPFATQRADTGAIADADSLPTGKLRRNTTDDLTVTIAVTHNGLGNYTASAVIPSTYVAGDDVSLIMSATVNGVAGLFMFDLGELVASTDPTRPVSLAQIKEYLRVDDDSQDGTLTDLLDFATEFVQRETGQQILTASKRAFWDCFPGTVTSAGAMWPGVVLGPNDFPIPTPPLQSVQSVKYLLSGVETTVDPSLYTVDAYSASDGGAVRMGRVVLNGGKAWPISDPVANAVRVYYTAGYGAPADVPNAFKQAIRWLTSHCYENREISVPAHLKVEELPYGLRSVIESLMFRESHAA